MFLRLSRLIKAAFVLASSVPALALAQGNSDNAPVQKQVEIIQSTHHDHNFYLGTTVGKPIDPAYFKGGKPKKRVPYEDSPNFDSDKAAQLEHIGTFAAAPTTAGPGFDGMGVGFVGAAGTTFTVQSMPPDTTGAVGTSQFVQWVNSSFTVFDKATGAPTYGPVAGNTLFTGFGGVCESSNDGDPVVMFDRIANRWVLMQFAVPTGGPYMQCVAVSKTADALGGWNRYAF